MNYFELYPGDYLRDTTRLSLVDHGAYLRMLMAYYAEEQPLPAEEIELFVIVSAVSASDKASVRKVAARFFPVGDDGLRRNGRADAEIAKAQKRIETARSNGSKNKPTKNPPGNPVGMPEGNPQATHWDTQRETHSGEALHVPHATLNQEREIDTPEPTPAALATIAMKAAGCVRLNPSNPELLAAIDEGVTPQQLADAVTESISRGIDNPFVYAIKTARSLHAAGASPTPAGASHGNVSTSRQSSVTDRIQQAIDERQRREQRNGIIEGTFAAVHA